MEKDSKINYSVNNEGQFGTVKIADDVVAMIAVFAAMEVDGVAGMSGDITSEWLSKAGIKNLKKGVKVEVTSENVRVELSISMKYGFNIPSTCSAVQNKVKSQIETMTGLNVSDVDVRITGITMN